MQVVDENMGNSEIGNQEFINFFSDASPNATAGGPATAEATASEEPIDTDIMNSPLPPVSEPINDSTRAIALPTQTATQMHITPGSQSHTRYFDFLIHFFVSPHLPS